MRMHKGLAFIGMIAALAGCGSGHDAPGDRATETPTTVAVNSTGSAPPAAFAVCSSCHAVEPGRTGVGPSLAGVWGRKAGSLAGYPYSPALKGAAITWNRASLDTWLQGPMKMVPGTKMVVGLTDPTGRKAVIDYLESLR